MFALPIFMQLLKTTICFIKIAVKLGYFYQKNAKFSSAGGSALRPPNQPPPLQIFSYAPSCQQNFGASHMYKQVIKKNSAM